jgi:hypothetical protein
VNPDGEYTTAGATVNPALIPGLSGPGGISVSGDKLFVANIDSGTIGEYTTDGATVNPALISGLYETWDVTAFEGYLFTTHADNGSNPNSIGEYTIAGATVNPVLISGLLCPFQTTVTPEPSTIALLAAALTLIGGMCLVRQRPRARRAA